MNTLADAWKWYQNTSQQLLLMKRLATKHWDALSRDEHLGQDDRFRLLNREVVEEEASFGLKHLQDLAIVVLFSVFEAQVRQHVLAEMEAEVKPLHHP